MTWEQWTKGVGCPGYRVRPGTGVVSRTGTPKHSGAAPFRYRILHADLAACTAEASKPLDLGRAADVAVLGRLRTVLLRLEDPTVAIRDRLFLAAVL